MKSVALNAMTDASRAAALALAKKGETFDLGLSYSRRSFKWPGHSPGEILTFRSPDGLSRMKDPDFPPPEKNADHVLWHSAAMFISDNVSTQIDGLAHITAGDDNHWYNGFTEAEWGGDWGPRKCDVLTIPPIVARGVLVDVAAFKKVDALPGHTVITTKDLQDTLAWEGVTLQPGDVVLVRTGTARFWGEDGADHAAIAEHDSAGPDLVATKWLIEQQGAIMVGSDTSGYEVNPPPGPSRSGIPVHKYLLVDQGVHIGEFHNLEGLSRAKPTRSVTWRVLTKFEAPSPVLLCARWQSANRDGLTSFDPKRHFTQSPQPAMGNRNVPFASPVARHKVNVETSETIMNTPRADALTERVERLERHCSLLQRSNRRWKGTALILILGGMVASVAGAWKEDGPKLVQVQELQTERLILHDKQGHRRSRLGLVSQRSGRADAHGRRRENPTLYDGAARGTTSLSLKDREGKERFTVSQIPGAGMRHCLS